jgi:hypothetical protein
VTALVTPPSRGDVEEHPSRTSIQPRVEPAPPLAATAAMRVLLAAAAEAKRGGSGAIEATTPPPRSVEDGPRSGREVG